MIRWRVKTRRGGWGFIVFIPLLGIGLLYGQRIYLQRELPRLAAALAEAEAEGPKILATITLPSGAVPFGEENKHRVMGGRRSMWQGTAIGLNWLRQYDVPGQWKDMADTYRHPLQAAGWVVDDDLPSDYRREFKRGKWRLTIGSHEWWDHPPVARVQIELSWAYLR